MANEGNDATHGTLHQIVNEAMRYLDPPPPEPLTAESVARAYTLLQQVCVDDGDCNHPRVQQMEVILDNKNKDNNNEWILQQADLYRSLLLASFLLLEMQINNVNNDDSTRVLQSSVERCLLLLQILYHSNSNSLPKSRHALLQAVLDEPLVPLDKQERQYMYVLQRNNKHDGMDDDESDVDENVVGTMDQKQLAKEEQQLLKLASKPIPNNHDYNQVMTEKQNVSLSVDNDIVHQGPLVWIFNEATTPCHVNLYACGLVTVTVPCDDATTSKQQRHKWLLMPTCTCLPQVGKDQTLCIHITGSCRVTSTKPVKLSNAPCSLEFQVNSLSEGYAWVTSIQQVIQEIQRLAKLQDDLRDEWKDEYDMVFSKLKE